MCIAINNIDLPSATNAPAAYPNNSKIELGLACQCCHLPVPLVTVEVAFPTDFTTAFGKAATDPALDEMVSWTRLLVMLIRAHDGGQKWEHFKRSGLITTETG